MIFQRKRHILAVNRASQNRNELEKDEEKLENILSTSKFSSILFSFFIMKLDIYFIAYNILVTNLIYLYEKYKNFFFYE